MVDTPTTTVPDTATLSAATSGDGTKLYVSLDGTTWTEVAELDDDDGLTDLPSGDQTTYETTHMGSGDFQEFKKNARRAGTETDITGNYALGSTTETTLEALDDSTETVPYTIVLKQGADVNDAVATDRKSVG